MTILCMFQPKKNENSQHSVSAVPFDLATEQDWSMLGKY